VHKGLKIHLPVRFCRHSSADRHTYIDSQRPGRYRGSDETKLFFFLSTMTGIMGALIDIVLGVATSIPLVNDMTN
jgi:hypothetical protein